MAHAPVQLDPAEPRRLPGLSGKWSGPATGVGIAALVIALVIGWIGGETVMQQVMFGYLVNFIFFLSIPVGALLFVMVHMLCKTGAVVTYRRIGEFIAATFPMLAVLAVPVVIAAWSGVLYESWVSPPPGDAIVAAKDPYLNLPFWTVRIALYFAVYILLAKFFLGKSLQQDATGAPRLTLNMQAAAGPGIIVYAFVTTFLATDLIKSLDAHWFSTIYGVYFFAGAFLAFHCVLALLLMRLQRQGVLNRSVTSDHYHDIGKMIFAFVVFWAYIAYSQYMLIWYGNIFEETGWYIRHGGSTAPEHWNLFSVVLVALLFGHFIIPFLGLVSRWIKRDLGKLRFWATWLLVFHWLDMFWLIRPELTDHSSHVAYHPSLPVGLMDIVALALCFVGIGGLCVAALARRMSDKPLLAEGDPRLQEGLAFHNH